MVQDAGTRNRLVPRRELLREDAGLHGCIAKNLTPPEKTPVRRPFSVGFGGSDADGEKR